MNLKESLESEYFAPGELDLILADQCAQFYDDPLGWVNWAFDWGYGELEGFEGPDKWQEDFLRSWGDEIKANKFDGVTPVMPVRRSVSSGHGIGKSAMSSWIILFIASTRPHSKGVVTSNTGDQLRTKTWGELGKWLSRCIVGHWFEYNNGKGSMSLYQKSFSESWRVDAQTCREENSEAFAGLHAANSTPFYLFDEASAVPESIYEVAEGGLTDGEPMFFCFGNPTRNTGAFKRQFNASSRWKTTQVDSRSAKMTNKKLINEWIDDHGEDSDFVRVRVRGMFPRAGDAQFMDGEIVTAAMNGEPGRYLPDEPLVAGFDVARGGDDNCNISFRRGLDAKSIKTYTIAGEDSRDSMRVVSKIVMIWERHNPDCMFIDVTGIGGPVHDRLKQLGYNVFPVGFGHKADDEKRYANKTAEMGDRMEKWLRAGGVIPNNPQLENELTAREFWHDDKDRLVLERKKDMKKRLGCSPDWADALYLTFAMKVPPLVRSRAAHDAKYYGSVSNSMGHDPLADF